MGQKHLEELHVPQGNHMMHNLQQIPDECRPLERQHVFSQHEGLSCHSASQVTLPAIQQVDDEFESEVDGLGLGRPCQEALL